MWLLASLKSIGKLVLLSVVVFLLKMGFRRLQHGLSVFTVFYTQYSKYYRKAGSVSEPSRAPHKAAPEASAHLRLSVFQAWRDWKLESIRSGSLPTLSMGRRASREMRAPRRPTLGCGIEVIC